MSQSHIFWATVCFILLHKMTWLFHQCKLLWCCIMTSMALLHNAQGIRLMVSSSEIVVRHSPLERIKRPAVKTAKNPTLFWCQVQKIREARSADLSAIPTLIDLILCLPSFIFLNEPTLSSNCWASSLSSLWQPELDIDL